MSNANNPPADAGMESLAAKEYMGELAYADKVLANCTEALQVLSSMMLNITETKGCNLRAGVMAADELIANVGEARKQIAKAAIHYVPAHYARAMPADAALVDEWNIEDLLATAVMYMRDVGMPNEADAIIELQSRNARLRALSQPAAVPEAVAKDAEREVRIKLMVATELLKRAEPFTLCSHSDLNREIYVFLNHAILSAADTEVKK